MLSSPIAATNHNALSAPFSKCPSDTCWHAAWGDCCPFFRGLYVETVFIQKGLTYGQNYKNTVWHEQHTQNWSEIELTIEA